MIHQWVCFHKICYSEIVCKGEWVKVKSITSIFLLDISKLIAYRPSSIYKQPWVAAAHLLGPDSRIGMWLFFPDCTLKCFIPGSCKSILWVFPMHSTVISLEMMENVFSSKNLGIWVEIKHFHMACNRLITVWWKTLPAWSCNMERFIVHDINSHM